ncbi:MAG TPA: WecB/TagA/CpsF family glycosyltransferase, partial [Pseudoneobacillus sp.]|nr:WecB/TagA/CpsF family glycosyltransferase [Pseudoneobacillus sp.]
MNKLPLFGLSIISDSKTNVVKSLTEAVQNEQKAFVATVNPKHIMQMDKQTDFINVLNKATHLVPDGMGIMKASELFQMPLAEKIPGIELMQDLLAFANETKRKVYLLG